MIANRAIALAHARPGMVPLRPAEIPVPRPARPPLYVPAGTTLPRGVAHRCLRPQTQWLPVAILGLKLAASVLAGATITLAFWPNDSKPVAQQVVEEGRARLAYELARRES